MKNYLGLINKVLIEGEDCKNRTGVGTRSVFGTRLEWDLRKGFPAVTAKMLAWNPVVSELKWFLSGSTNVEELRKLTYGPNSNRKVIWDDNYLEQGIALGYQDGELGPVYGKQWRDFGGVDQIENLISSVKGGIYTGVHSRRNLVVSWNPPELDKMSLPPCHYAFQVHVNQKKELSLMWHQRSVDVFLGLPFNIASYALLTHILAQICGCTVGKLIFTGGDTHIYKSHMIAIGEILTRTPLQLPNISMPSFTSLAGALAVPSEKFILTNYSHCGVITAPMAK